MVVSAGRRVGARSEAPPSEVHDGRARRRIHSDSFRLGLVLAVAIPTGVGFWPPAPASAVAPPSGKIDQVRDYEGIRESVLPNGLRLLLAPDPSSPTVTVVATYLVGSRQEGPGERGMTHMLEHLLAKGTARFPSLMDTLAARGADFNGSTWYDRTEFHETLPAGRNDLDFLLCLEAERMSRAALSEAELLKEMSVITNEFQMVENDLPTVLSQRMLSSAYLWHTYAFPTIGNLSEIQSYSIESLRRFYAAYYRPDNAVLYVGGRFEMEQAADLVVRYFGPLPGPAPRRDEARVQEPSQEGPRSVVVEHAGKLGLASLMHHVPAGSHPDSPLLRVLQAVLLDESSGPLHDGLVKPGLAVRVTSGASDALVLAEPGVVEFGIEAAPDRDPREVLQAAIPLLEGAGGPTVTDEAVALAKARLLKEIRWTSNDATRLGVELAEWIALGDWRLYFQHRDRIAAATAADVARVARQYLVESNRTEGILLPVPAPARVVIPPAPSLGELPADPEHRSSGATTSARPLSLQEIKDGTVRLTVAPGIDIALLVKETRGQMVQAELRFHYGTEKELAGHVFALRLLPAFLMRGTVGADHKALRNRIDLLQSDIDLGGREGVLTATIVTDRAHLVPCLEIVADIVRRPALDKDEFEIVRRERLARLQAVLSDPVEQSFNALRRQLYPWPATSVNHMATTEEEIAAVTALSATELRDLHRRLLGASHAKVAIVGDFDRGAAAAALGRLFDDWKSPTPYERVAMPYLPIRPGHQTIAIPGKAMAVTVLGAHLPVRQDDPEYPALKAAIHVLAEQSQSRLSTHLRQERGLTYHAGGALSADAWDRSACMFLYAFCPPDSTAAALQAMQGDLARLVAHGITQPELDETRATLTQSFATDLAANAFVAGELLQGLEHDRCFSDYPEFLARLRAVSVGDVSAALTRFLGAVPLASVTAGDVKEDGR